MGTGVCEVSEVVAEEVAAILTASRDGTARLWNTGTGECEFIMEGHNGPVTCVQATPDLKWVTTASEDQTTKIWALDRINHTAVCVWTLRGHDQEVLWSSFSPDGKYVATASMDRTARVWLMKSRKCVMLCQGHQQPVISV